MKWLVKQIIFKSITQNINAHLGSQTLTSPLKNNKMGVGGGEGGGDTVWKPSPYTAAEFVLNWHGVWNRCCRNRTAQHCRPSALHQPWFQHQPINPPGASWWIEAQATQHMFKCTTHAGLVCLQHSYWEQDKQHQSFTVKVTRWCICCMFFSFSVFWHLLKMSSTQMLVSDKWGRKEKSLIRINTQGTQTQKL